MLLSTDWSFSFFINGYNSDLAHEQIYLLSSLILGLVYLLEELVDLCLFALLYIVVTSVRHHFDAVGSELQIAFANHYYHNSTSGNYLLTNYKIIY